MIPWGGSRTGVARVVVDRAVDVASDGEVAGIGAFFCGPVAGDNFPVVRFAYFSEEIDGVFGAGIDTE